MPLTQQQERVLGKEAHSTQRIMKDADCAKAQEARRAAVKTSQDILKRTAFRLWREWTERHAARRASRRFELLRCCGSVVTRVAPSAPHPAVITSLTQLVRLWRRGGDEQNRLRGAWGLGPFFLNRKVEGSDTADTPPTPPL